MHHFLGSFAPSRLCVKIEGKELDFPVPPRYRNRVNSLYLPAGSFPAPGDPNTFTPRIGE